MSERPSFWGNTPRGFRIMWWDPVVMLLCAVLVWAGWDLLGPWTLLAPFVLGTFFLFCNVFRVRRNLELLWGATFVVNVALWMRWDPSLAGMLATQSGVTALVIGLTVRSPGYRGVLSRAPMTITK